MAVSQVEALKKPCRVWMWKILVASQPPSSAPAMPIRQVRMRPCCRRPGISMLAIRPAPSPRMIQAMMPMIDSLVSHACGVDGCLVDDQGTRRCCFRVLVGAPAGGPKDAVAGDGHAGAGSVQAAPHSLSQLRDPGRSRGDREQG